jgi:hypothetical protein
VIDARSHDAHRRMLRWSPRFCALASVLAQEDSRKRIADGHEADDVTYIILHYYTAGHSATQLTIDGTAGHAVPHPRTTPKPKTPQVVPYQNNIMTRTDDASEQGRHTHRRKLRWSSRFWALATCYPGDRRAGGAATLWDNQAQDTGDHQDGDHPGDFALHGAMRQRPKALTWPWPPPRL